MNAPSATVTMLPAERMRSTRERLTQAEQIPPHVDCISRPGGPLTLRSDDQKIVAVLQLSEGRDVEILWTGVAEHRDVLIAVERRLRSANWNPIGTLEATPDVISLCYDRESLSYTREEFEASEAMRQFDGLIARAAALNASDLHLHMMERSGLARARVNGELIDLGPIKRSDLERMVRAGFTACEVDSRLGNDSFNPRDYLDASLVRRVKVGDRTRQLKLRWASGPTWPDGFDVQLRLQSTDSGQIRTFGELGFPPDQIAMIEEAIQAPRGVILLVGGTGSGKSTTLASMGTSWLQRHAGRLSLRTIEDPVETVIPGARHMPVSRGRGGEGGGADGFQKALKGSMRMDPDALLIGEVRDETTARLMLQAQQTGHKVFATVHAGSPLAAFGRLGELGISRGDLAGEEFITLIVHQVLLAMLCPHCRISYASGRGQLPARECDEIESRMDTSNLYLRGPGCDAPGCHGGHAGRTVVATMLNPDRELRQHLLRGEDTLAAAYWRGGLMLDDGPCQARSARETAQALVAAGNVSPLTASLALGGLFDRRTSEQERAWYEEARRKHASAP